MAQPRLRRALTYGLAGSALEAVFTSAVASWGRRRLEPHGPSTPLMVPLYGLALPLFEPLHDRLRSRPALQRASAYAAGILAVEYLSGWLMRRVTGRCPWDYMGQSRFALAGLIRLDYAPLWGLFGLALERLHDGLVGYAVTDREAGRGAAP